MVGLTYEGSDKQEVILAVKAQQIPYLKSLPLHHSQIIKEGDETEALVHYHLKPNYEFTQRIFMLMNDAKVIKPDWLVKEIKERIDEMKQRY